jgi:16S rRNA C1402 (ribose-2'-O) methylase RsmI
VFEKAKSDPQARELIRVHEKAVRDYASDLESYLQEGLRKGLTVFTFNFSAFEGSAAQRPKIVKIN